VRREGRPDEAVSFSGSVSPWPTRLSWIGKVVLLNDKHKRANLGMNLTLVGIRTTSSCGTARTGKRYLQDNLTQYQQQMMQARQTVLHKQAERSTLGGCLMVATERSIQSCGIVWKGVRYG
jgi:hypothetical protein